jgi:hypothetical protein
MKLVYEVFMDEEPNDSAAAKRERIKAISRTVHSIPVEEGGQLRPVRPLPEQPAPAPSWKRKTLAAGGVGAVAFGFLAGLVAGRYRR